VEDKRSLINKFLSGEISDSEIDSLKEWLEEDPANRNIFDEENEIWQEAGIKTKHDYFLADKAWSELSAKLGGGTRKTGRTVTLHRNNFRIILAAATVAVIIAIGSLSLYLSHIGSATKRVAATTFIKTEEGEKAHIILSDSTSIEMNSGTTIEYPDDFNFRDRSVKLSGEAYFNIYKNTKMPFNVHLNKMTITATGTRFNVFSYNDGDRIETTLEEGSIQVAIDGKEIIDVKPGQQVVYFTKSDNAILRDVATDTYTSWKENKLRLNDTPLEEAFRRIGRRYNVTFEIRSYDLLDLKYTATFIDESIEQVMQMLGTVSPIKYKIINRTKINDRNYLKPKIIVEKRNI
jgi:ferric-dicitrate binding protein FerR (iron transport regulator)